MRVAAACSLLPLPPPLGRGLACGARAGGRRVVGGGGWGVLASVVRAAGKASVTLVPPVAAAGLRGCGAAGPRAVGGGGGE
jgi:hypothetical protein